MVAQKSRWQRNLANKNKKFYVRDEIDIHIEILQPRKHDETKTTEWLHAQIDKFRELIGEEGGLVRVYHCV